VDLDAQADGERTLALEVALRNPDVAHPPLPRVESDALASILYTSGTTGTPKGVMLSHGNFLANADSVMKFRLVNAQDNLLSVLPLHHAFAFTVQLILLFTGAQITFPPSLKGPDLLACMHETGVTVLVAVPQLFYLLHKGIFDQIGKRPLLVRALLRLLLRLSGAVRPSGINLGRLVFGQVHRRFGGRIRIMASGGARLDPLIARDFLALGFTLTEGYGLTPEAVQRYAVARDIDLIITVDCGIGSHEAVETARKAGIDVIITDHHQVPERLPDALAIINPKRPDCPSPFSWLAGVGVAFNLDLALRKNLREAGFWENHKEPNLKAACDLVALGTVADMVPLVEENRIFVREGLQILSECPRPGLKALLDVAGGPTNGALDAWDLAFKLAPRLNAAGRLGSGRIGC